MSTDAFDDFAKTVGVVARFGRQSYAGPFIRREATHTNVLAWRGPVEGLRATHAFEIEYASADLHGRGVWVVVGARRFV